MSPLVSALLRHVTLHPRTPLGTSAGVVGRRRAVVLEIRDRDGARGFGEASPLAGWHAETLAGAEAGLVRALSRRLGSAPPAGPDDLLAWCDEPGLPPSASFALGTAAVDLVSRRQGLPAATFLGARGTPMVRVNGVVGADDPAPGAASLAAAGFGAIKIKLLSADPLREAARANGAADAVPAGVRVRLDANRAFSPDDALRFAALLGPGRFDYVEEPARSVDFDLFGRLSEEFSLPVALDESAGDPAVLTDALASGNVAVIVTKPSVVGPLGETVRRGRLVAAGGAAHVVTSTVDGPVATAAAAHLAAVAAAGRDAGLSATCGYGAPPTDEPSPALRLDGAGFDVSAAGPAGA